MEHQNFFSHLPLGASVHFYSDVHWKIHSLLLFFLTWSDSFTAYAVVGGQCLFLVFFSHPLDSQWSDMHVDSFIVCLFFFHYGKTNKNKKKTRSSLVFNKQWRRMDQYKILCKMWMIKLTFSSSPCAGCWVLMVYKYGAWKLFCFLKGQ